jgi:hypothetical protein
MLAPQRNSKNSGNDTLKWQKNLKRQVGFKLSGLILLAESWKAKTYETIVSKDGFKAQWLSSSMGASPLTSFLKFGL